jgi:hypothetical protein
MRATLLPLFGPLYHDYHAAAVVSKYWTSARLQTLHPRANKVESVGPSSVVRLVWRLRTLRSHQRGRWEATVGRERKGMRIFLPLASDCVGSRWLKVRGMPLVRLSPQLLLHPAEPRPAAALLASAFAGGACWNCLVCVSPMRVPDVDGKQAELPHDLRALTGRTGDLRIRAHEKLERRAAFPAFVLVNRHGFYSRAASPRQITRILLYNPSPSLMVSMSP